MKRVFALIGLLEIKEPKVTHEEMIDAELVKLSRRTPRTKAEKQFHKWLIEWKATLPKKALS